MLDVAYVCNIYNQNRRGETIFIAFGYKYIEEV